jgi:hypothetical protein
MGLCLDENAVQRILDATDVRLSKSKIDNAHHLFIAKNIVESFSLWHNALTANKSPSETGKKIKSSLSHVKSLLANLSEDNIDYDIYIDFRTTYKIAHKEFGEDKSIEYEEMLSNLKLFLNFLQKADELNTPRIGQDTKQEAKNGINWLILELMKIYEDLYEKKPAFNTRRYKDGKSFYDTPFLRFARQVMKEIRDLGIDIDQQSITSSAIRSRSRSLKNKN